MFARIYGATILGLHGNIITVETDISNGLPRSKNPKNEFAQQ